MCNSTALGFLALGERNCTGDVQFSRFRVPSQGDPPTRYRRPYPVIFHFIAVGLYTPRFLPTLGSTHELHFGPKFCAFPPMQENRRIFTPLCGSSPEVRTEFGASTGTPRYSEITSRNISSERPTTTRWRAGATVALTVAANTAGQCGKVWVSFLRTHPHY